MWNCVTNILEYEKLISEKPDITEEDFIYIEEILSNSMDKKNSSCPRFE